MMTPIRNPDRYTATLAFLYAEICRDAWIEIMARWMFQPAPFLWTPEDRAALDTAEREAAREFRIHDEQAESLMVQQMRASGLSQHDAELLAIGA